VDCSQCEGITMGNNRFICPNNCDDKMFVSNDHKCSCLSKENNEVYPCEKCHFGYHETPQMKFLELTDNCSGIDNFMLLCDTNTTVEKLEFLKQPKGGIINMKLHCSNNMTALGSDRWKQGTFAKPVQCKDGALMNGAQIQSDEESGITNFRAHCDDGTWTEPSNPQVDKTTSWGEAMKCSKNQYVVGLNARLLPNSDTMVNLHVYCDRIDYGDNDRLYSKKTKHQKDKKSKPGMKLNIH